MFKTNFSWIIFKRHVKWLSVLKHFYNFGNRRQFCRSTKLLSTNNSIQEISEHEYHQVMAIRKPEDVYHGWDYLPDYFLSLVRTPGYTAYASYVESKMVAFGLSVVVDDAKTLVTRAGRVSKNFEGRGVFGDLDKFIRNKYEGIPNVLYQAVTFTNENQRMKDSVQTGSFNLILRKNIYTYKASATTIKRNTGLNVPDTDNTAIIDEPEISNIFSSERDRKNLFPDDRFVIDWVPYRPILPNICFIINDRCLILGTKLGSLKTEVMFSLLSCGTFLRCNAGFNYNCDIYGQDKTFLKDHIYYHLNNVQKKFSGQMRFVIYSYDNICPEYYDQIMLQFGFRRSDSPIVGLYCAEKLLTKTTKNENKTSKVKTKS